jgi:tetratricopeptide (TPR) repeat protein
MGLPIFDSGIQVVNGRVSSLSALALLAVGLAGASAHAAETVLMNESAAHLCYLEAARGGTLGDTEDCNVAIDHQSLKREDFAATLSNRGLLLARNNDLDSALRDHDRAIETAPEIPSLYVNRANTYTRAQRFDAARSDLDRAIALVEERVAVAAPVASGAAEAGTATANAAAQPEAESGAAQVPFAAESAVLGAALFNRALIEQREGNLDAALADATRARDLVSDRPMYAEYVQDLERIRAKRTPPAPAEEPTRAEG